MCKFFSGIVTKNFRVLTDGNMSSHEKVIETHNLNDKLAIDDERRDWLRFEIVPKDVFSLRKEDWVFQIDEKTTPKWFSEVHKDACYEYLFKNVLKTKWFSAARKEVQRINKIKWFKPMKRPNEKEQKRIAARVKREFKLKGELSVKFIPLLSPAAQAWLLRLRGRERRAGAGVCGSEEGKEAKP
jgi:hypothetical protein